MTSCQNVRIVSVGVVGVGGWGKNLVRNYYYMRGAWLKYVCDLAPDKLEANQLQFPADTVTQDIDVLLGDRDLDAIVIATPGNTHFGLCKQALLAGKDVFVEKPFTLCTAEAEELVDLAKSRNRVLMVGHLLKFHPVVERLKTLVQSGELGRVLYIYSQRLNLGTVRSDENALWNFAPHDISVILYLLDLVPTDVSARGQSYLRRGIEDVVFLSIDFGGKAMGHVHVSWLDPHKTRRITIVGSKRMAVFDDLESNEKLKIYDKGAEMNTDYDTFAEYIGLRFGDITIPYVRAGEPLRAECDHFLDCVRERKTPLSDGQDGMRVVRVLEAASESLKSNGTPVAIGSSTA